MFDINSEEFVTELSRVLSREIDLYEKYNALLLEERQYVVKFKEDRVASLTEKRAEVFNEIALVQDELQALIKLFPMYREMRLRDLIIKNMRPQYVKQLLPIIDNLRDIVKKTKNIGNQHSKILNFSLRSIQGVMSIIKSATQTIVKSYNKRGRIQNSYHPANASRKNSILRKA